MAAAILGYWRRVRGFRRNAKLYLLSTILRSMTWGLSSLLFNLYLLSMGFDAPFIGLNNTLRSVGSMICSLPAGLIADRIGRKRAMVIGLAGMTIAQLGVSIFTAGWLIAASSALFGIVGSLFLISIAPFLTENSTDKERSTLFTLNSSLMNLVSFFVMTGGGYLPRVFAALLHVTPSSGPAYRGAMLTSACCLVLGMVPILGLKDEGRSLRTRPVSRSVPHVWQSFSDPRLLVKLIIPRALTAFGAGLIFPFINLFYRQRFGVSDATLGWILGITSATAAVVMLVGGGLADRFGKIRAMFVARAISTPLLLIIGFVPYLPIAAAAHWIRSGFMRLGEPLYLAFAMEQLAKEERATGSSLMTLGWDAGWSAGPWASGLAQVQFGFGPLFAATTAFYTLSLISVYFFFIRRSKAG